MALMMTTPTTNPMATPSSSTAGQIPMALQHSPSPPPMTRSNSYLRRQQQQQEQQQQQREQGEVVAARAASSTSTKVSPRSGGTKRRSSGMSEAAEASAAGGGLQDTLSERMTHKDEVRKLATRLATRLQYAAFKVERGWTRHSLPEVENLYWRATRTASGSSSTAPAPSNARRSSGEVRPRADSSGAQSSLLPPITSYSSTQQPAAKRSRRSDGSAEGRDDDGDVFGGRAVRVPSGGSNSGSASKHSSQQQQQSQPRRSVVINASGQPTPPPSAGTEHLSSAPSSSSSARHTTHQSLDPAALRISPTRTVQALRAANAGQTSGAAPSATLPPPRTGSGRMGSPTSYADFWSKLGQSAAAGRPAAAAATTAAVADQDALQRGKKRPRESDALPRREGA